MKNTQNEVKALQDRGIKFDAPRMELAKKDEKGVPQSTGVHTVIILRDEKKDDIKEFTGANSYKEVQGIRYWFNEGGVEKYYDVPLFKKGTKDEPNYLISKFAELNEGDEITMQYVRKGDKGFIEIKKVGYEDNQGGFDEPSIQEDL